MVEQQALQRTLHAQFQAAQLKNPAFSLRAFAKRLGLAHSALSEILNGKRRVSLKLAKRLLERSDIDPQKSRAILKLFDRDQETSAAAYTPLDMEQFKIISEWFHFAILSLAETSDFRDEPAWIADRLNIRTRDAEQALKRLEDLAFLKRGKSGKLKASGIQYTTSDDVKSLALRRCHAQNLELAKNALETVEISERDFTSLTLALDPEQLPLAKKLIRKFQDEFEATLPSKRKLEVYKLCMQFFPLSQRYERKPHGNA
jgi:uncharacterized protein (TIGR02147 family)